MPKLCCFLLLFLWASLAVAVYDGSAAEAKEKQREDFLPLNVHGYDSSISTTYAAPVVIDPRRRSRERGEARSAPGHVVASGYSRVSGTAIGRHPAAVQTASLLDDLLGVSRRGQDHTSKSEDAAEGRDDTRDTGGRVASGRERDGDVASERGRSVDSRHSLGGNSDLTGPTNGRDNSDNINHGSSENITPRRRSRLGRIWNNIRRRGGDVGNAVLSSATDRLEGSYNRAVSRIGLPLPTVTTTRSPARGRAARPDASVPLSCPGPNGLFPHPHECSKYLQCAHNSLFIRDCGPGTVFNSAISVCDWPYNVNCQVAVTTPILPTTTWHEFDLRYNFEQEGNDHSNQGKSPSEEEVIPQGRSPTHLVDSVSLIDSLMDTASDIRSRTVGRVRNKTSDTLSRFKNTTNRLLNSVGEVVDQVNWGFTRTTDSGKRILKNVGFETETLCPSADGLFPYHKGQTMPPC